MSRRHKENDISNNYTTQQGSHEDSCQESHSRSFSVLSFVKRIVTIDNPKYDSLTESLGKALYRALGQAIGNVTLKAFEKNKIVVDDDYVKIPRSFFDENLKNSIDLEPYIDDATMDECQPQRGRPPIKRLFRTIEDSKVAKYFKKTLHAVQKKCMQLFENVAQFAVCFLHGSYKAFSPDDDPYGKLSHLYRVIKPEIVNPPTLRTLNNYLAWFRDWRPVADGIKENIKEKKERLKHKIWRQLIDWIYHYLLKIAPEYAFA